MFNGARCKYYRQKAQLTQEQLGEAANCSERTIGRWERGETEPSLGELEAIARAENVPVAVLLQGDDATLAMGTLNAFEIDVLATIRAAPHQKAKIANFFAQLDREEKARGRAPTRS